MSRAYNAAKFSAIMRDLAKVPSRISRQVAQDISKEIQRSMSAGKDPYGKPWPKKADGSTSKLRKTGRGRASIRVVPTAGAGIRITVGILYMIYHQFGGRSHLRGRRKNKDFGRDKDRSGGRNRPPQRMYIPFDTLPTSWGELALARLEEAAQKVLRG